MLPWVQFKILTAPQWVEKCSHQKKVKPAMGDSNRFQKCTKSGQKRQKIAAFGADAPHI
jgi:hypothetical protein